MGTSRLQFGGLCIAGLVALACAGTASAEKLPLARAFGAPALAGASAQGVQVSPDGRYVSYLEADPAHPEQTLLRVRPSLGGAPRTLVSTSALGTAPSELSDERMKFLERRHIATGDALEYRWSPDATHVLVTFAGDLFLVATRDGAVARLTTTEDSEHDAKPSPDGRHVAFVRGRNLFVRSLDTGREQPMGVDAGDDVAYGIAEFVAQEEMQRFTGHWWSPDGGRIAYTRIDESAVHRMQRVRIDPKAIDVVSDRFPLAGTPNVGIRVYVRAMDGGAPVEVDLGPDPDVYVYDCAWSRDARTLYVQRQSRDQKRLDLLAVDPASGASRVILSETDPTWVDLGREFRPLADGTFLWASPRSGWRHLYLYGREGRLLRQVTSGDWRIAFTGPQLAAEASPVVAVDETRQEVYFIASRETPLEQHLYAVSYRRPGEPRKLTDGHGWWTPTMAADRPRGFVATYSDPETPPRSALFDLRGRRVAWLVENRLDANHPYAPYLDHKPTVEYGTIKADDGHDLHFLLVKPRDFDPSRRYPVILNPYGGPGVQTVRREWRGVIEQVLAQEGYLVFKLDNRGMANRDHAFEHAIHDDLRSRVVADQLAGVRWLRAQPFVDGEHIGSTGWSFGAYTTVLLMTEPGSGIRAGSAGGTPADFRMYDTHYTERFLGSPEKNARAYDASALLPRMKDLSGELLLMQGLSDDNVMLPNFTALVSALQAAGKTFSTSVYPGQSHYPRGAATQTHLWKTELELFARTLKPQSCPENAPPSAAAR